jgi:hypothetical protein
VRARGYRILFDFANVIAHYPTSSTFTAGRAGDLRVKIYNAAYNHAFVLGKHMTGCRRAACLAHMLGVGATGGPGLLAFGPAVLRYGHPLRECGILAKTMKARIAGWHAGSRARPQPPQPAPPPRLPLCPA